MAQRTSPILYHAFRMIQMTLRTGSPHALEHIYQAIPAVNFSSGICEPLSARLAVLPVLDVGWSDWGTPGSIMRTLENLGEFEAFCARRGVARAQPVWHSANRPASRPHLGGHSVSSAASN
jgi:hypothetical protein